MAIKVTIGESKTQEEKPFPKFMQDKHGNIVFAIGKNNNSEEQYYYKVVYIKGFEFSEFSTVGSFCDEFNLFNSDNPYFDYNEPITLQNQ
jgi:hypothetical protein